MRARWKRWSTAVLAVAAVDAAVLLAAGLVLSGARQLHDSAFTLVGLALADLGSLMPAGIARGMNAILGILGVGWWQRIVGPTLTGGSGSGAPVLAGVLAAPVYTVVRRKIRAAPRPQPPTSGAPPHRIYQPIAQVYEPSRRISTAVQESV